MSSQDPYRECPSFDVCSCNVCPLDPAMRSMRALPGEDTCKAKRSTRERIAAKYPTALPWGGLLPREIARDRRKAVWAALPEDHPRKQRLAAATALRTHKVPVPPGQVLRPPKSEGQNGPRGHRGVSSNQPLPLPRQAPAIGITTK